MLFSPYAVAVFATVLLSACVGGAPGMESASASSSSSSSPSSQSTGEGTLSTTTTITDPSTEGTTGEVTITTGTTGTAGTTGGSSTTAETSGEETTTSGDPECLGEAGPDAAWSRRITPMLATLGDPSLAVDPSGAVLLSARFREPLDLGGGPLEGGGDHHRHFLVKYGPCEHLWSLMIGGDEGELSDFAFAADAAGNVVVVGSFAGTIDLGGTLLTATFGIDQQEDILYATSDLFIAKYSPDGELLWGRRFGDDDYQRAHGVATTDAGGLVVVGGIRGTVDFGDAIVVADDRYDGLLAEFTGDGELTWSLTFDAPADVGMFDVDVNAGGLISVGGMAASGVDFGGGPLPVEDEDYGFYAQFEPSGEHRWSRRVVAGVEANAFDVDDAGAVYVAGETSKIQGQPTDAVLLKFADEGALAWTRSGGATEAAPALGVAITAQGDVEIIGGLVGTVDFGDGPLVAPIDLRDLYFASFTGDGGIIGSDQLNVPLGTYVTARAFKLGAGGERVVAGRFVGTLDFGEGPLTALSESDAFVHRDAP